MSVRLTDDQSRRLGGRAGREVVLGVRPEALGLAAQDAESRPLDLSVSVIEPLGAAMDVFGHTSDNTRLVARVPAEAGVLDAKRITLHLHTKRVHVFEQGAHGANLLLDSTGASR
jgi:ABC-type sugar transport system ATPase subunit